MAGKKKRGAGGKAASPRTPTRVVTEKEAEVLPEVGLPEAEKETPEENVAGTVRVRSKKVDNGDHLNGVMHSSEEQHAAAETLKVDHQNGISEQIKSEQELEESLSNAEGGGWDESLSDIDVEGSDALEGQAVQEGRAKEVEVSDMSSKEVESLDTSSKGEEKPDTSLKGVEKSDRLPEEVEKSDTSTKEGEKLDTSFKGVERSDTPSKDTSTKEKSDTLSKKVEESDTLVVSANALPEGGKSLDIKLIEPSDQLQNDAASSLEESTFLAGQDSDSGMGEEVGRLASCNSEELNAYRPLAESTSHASEPGSLDAVPLLGKGASSTDVGLALPEFDQPSAASSVQAADSETYPINPPPLTSPSPSPQLVTENPQPTSVAPPPQAIPSFLSPTRSTNLSLASADDDTAFFEHLLEDSDEDEVTSSRAELLTSSGTSSSVLQPPPNPGVAPLQPGTSAQPLVEVPFSPFSQTQSAQSSPSTSTAIPFGPISPPEVTQWSSSFEMSVQVNVQSGAGIPQLPERPLGAFGSGVQLGDSTVPASLPPESFTFGNGPVETAPSPGIPGQSAPSWDFPTPRGEEDVEFFAIQGGQPSPEALPNFPPVQWQQPGQQQSFPPLAQPAWTYPPSQDDGASFFDQDTPKDPQAPNAPLSNGPMTPSMGETKPFQIGERGQTNPFQTESSPASSWSFPSPVGGDDGALFFEQAAATPPAVSSHSPSHFASPEPFVSPLSFEGEAVSSHPPNPFTPPEPFSSSPPYEGEAPQQYQGASGMQSEVSAGLQSTSAGPVTSLPSFLTGVSDSLAGVSETSAALETAAVAASIPSWNFAVEDDGDASFFESIGNQDVQQGVQETATVSSAYEAQGVSSYPGQDWYAGAQTQQQAYDPNQYWSEQYNQTYDWSQYQQQGGAYSHETAAPAPDMGVSSPPEAQTIGYNQSASPYGAQGAYPAPDPSFPSPPNSQTTSYEQSASWYGPQGAYSHAPAPDTSITSPPVSNTTSYDQSASWHGVQGPYPHALVPNASTPESNSIGYGAQEANTWQPQEGATWQPQGAWPQQMQQDDAEQFFEQMGGESAAPDSGVNKLAEQSGTETLHEVSRSEFAPAQQPQEPAQQETPLQQYQPSEFLVPQQDFFSPHTQPESQPPHQGAHLENQHTPQQDFFSPQMPFHGQSESQPSHQGAHFEKEHTPQQDFFSPQTPFPAQAEGQPPHQGAHFGNEHTPQQDFLSPEMQPESQPPHFESLQTPLQQWGQEEAFFSTPPPNQPSFQPPISNNFLPQRSGSVNSLSALPPLPKSHRRSASATSQPGSEHDWSPPDVFAPRPPFFVPSNVNNFQPPKPSTPAFIPAQADYGGSGFSALGQWAQHTAVPRSTAEAMQTSVGRPPCALITFGFGGKLVVIKPRESLGIGTDLAPPGASFGVAQSSLQIHSLSQLVTSSSADGGKGVGSLYFDALGKRAFAGPLAGGHTPAKELAKWFDERMARCHEEETDHQSHPTSLRLLYGLLKAAAQNYGKLRAGTAQTGGQEKGAAGPEAALAALLSSPEQPGAASPWGVTKSRVSDPLQHPPTEQELKSTAVEMQRLLVAGNRKDALSCARQGQLWGPALVLARQLGDKAFCETVGEMAQRQFALGSPLRTLHLLLAQQPAEVFAGRKMAAQGDSPMAGGASQAPGLEQDTGLSSMLDQWQDNLAILASNRAAGDDKVITHLGDSLWRTRGEFAAAHMCYLVADAQLEAFSVTSRVCLIGVDQYKYPRTFATPEGIQRTELYEHAKMLGNPQFVLPTFQPYKLLYASMLAEAGKTAEALKYCQLVLKTLRAGGRSPDVEAIRQGATVLEDRLQNHVRSGASTSSAKIFSGLFKAVDWGIKGIMGSGSRPTSPVKEEAQAPLVPSWGTPPVIGNNSPAVMGNSPAVFGKSPAAMGNSPAVFGHSPVVVGSTAGALMVGHQWAAQVQGPSQQWGGDNVAAFSPPLNEQQPAWGQNVSAQQQQASTAWQGGSAQPESSWQGGQSQPETSWSAAPAQGEDAEGGGSAFSSRPPTPGQSWNVSSGSRPSSPVGHTQSQQWGVSSESKSALGGNWATQSAPLIPAFDSQAVASTADSKAPPHDKKQSEERLKSTHRSASEPDFAKNGETDKDSGPKSVGGGSSPVKKTFAGGFLRASSGIWGGLKNSLSSVVPAGGGNQAKLGDKNKFYYDEKRKKWVLEGEPEAEEEAPLAPPPRMANFLGASEGQSSPPINLQAPPAPPAPTNVSERSPAMQGSAALPPAPPSASNFSARGRTGVRSRYVDTFNKGGGAAAGAAKPLALPARPPAPAPMKFFIPPPAPLGTIVDSESESDPPQNGENNQRDSPSTSTESSKAPLPHGHKRSHSSETSSHPHAQLGGSQSAGGAGSPKKAHSRASSAPAPMNFFVPGPPPPQSQADAVPRESASNGSAYSFAPPGASTSGYGPTDTWQPKMQSSSSIPPPPDIGQAGTLPAASEPGGGVVDFAQSAPLGAAGDTFFNSLGSSGPSIGEGHAKGFEVEEMTEVDLL